MEPQVKVFCCSETIKVHHRNSRTGFSPAAGFFCTWCIRENEERNSWEEVEKVEEEEELMATDEFANFCRKVIHPVTKIMWGTRTVAVAAMSLLLLLLLSSPSSAAPSASRTCSHQPPKPEEVRKANITFVSLTEKISILKALVAKFGLPTNQGNSGCSSEIYCSIVILRRKKLYVGIDE